MSGSARKRATAVEPAAVPGDEKPKRKNHYLYQSKLDRAKKILGAKTETEALDGALDMLIYGEAMARGTEEMEGEEYEDVLGLGRNTRRRPRAIGGPVCSRYERLHRGHAEP